MLKESSCPCSCEGLWRKYYICLPCSQPLSLESQLLLEVRCWAKLHCAVTSCCFFQLLCYVPGVTSEMVIARYVFVLLINADLGGHRSLSIAQYSAVPELISCTKFSGQRAALVWLHSFQTEAGSWSTRLSSGRAAVWLSVPTPLHCLSLGKLRKTVLDQQCWVYVWMILFLNMMHWKHLFSQSPLFKIKIKKMNEVLHYPENPCKYIKPSAVYL